MAWLAHNFVRRDRYFLRALKPHCRLASNDQAQSLKPFSEIPGPKGLPIVGSLFDIMRSLSKAGDEHYFHQLLLKYGPVVKVTNLGFESSVSDHSKLVLMAREGARLFGRSLVVIGTPEDAAKVFRAEGKYPARSYLEETLGWIYNKNNFLSMTFAGGKEWKHIRSSASKQIVPRRVANYAPGLCEIGDNFVEYIRHKRGPDSYVEDVHSANMKWAFQGVGYMVYGEQLNTFDESRKDLLEFQNVAMEAIGLLARISNEPPLYKYFPTKTYRRFVGALTHVHEYGSTILKEKYDKMVDAINSGVVDETKATSMMEQWLIEGNFSPKEALMLSCDLLAAGIDTSSNTATILLHEVAKQPALQEKLYQEVSSVLGDRNSPSFDDLQKMTLVRSCIKEILRLQPTLSVVMRDIDQEIVICGYQIPAKTTMIYSTYTASRDPKYVDDPTSFKPERWSKDSTEDLDAFVSLPFGFGPRSCYGRRLAELELFILLCKVSRYFRLSTQQQSLKIVQATVTKADELVKIKFIDRK